MTFSVDIPFSTTRLVDDLLRNQSNELHKKHSAVLTLIVTCSNIQSIRDEYVSKPNNIEKSVSNLIDRILPEEDK